MIKKYKNRVAFLNKKNHFKFILIIIFFLFVSTTSELTGIVKVYDSSYIGRPLSSGIVYNPDEYIAGSNKFDYFSVLLIENLTNHKKTIVYVVDKIKPSSPDIILYISKRAAKELGEIIKTEFPVKVTLLKKIDKENYLQIMKETSKNALKEKDIVKNNYYIQVGAFFIVKNLEEVKNKLISLGFNVIIKEKKVNNKILYKVLVGPYSKIEASDVLNLIKKLGFKDCFILKM